MEEERSRRSGGERVGDGRGSRSGSTDNARGSRTGTAGRRRGDRPRPATDGFDPAGAVGEAVRTVLVMGGVGLFGAAVYLAGTEGAFLMGGTPSETLTRPWHLSHELTYRALVALVGTVAGGAVASLGATVPGEGPAPLVPDPGLGDAGRRRVLAGVLVSVPGVLELALAAVSMQTNVEWALPTLVTVGVPTVALAGGLVLAGFSTARSLRLPVRDVDRLVRRLGRARDRVRSSLAGDPRGWGWSLVACGLYALLVGGVVVVPALGASYNTAGRILGLSSGVPLVVLGLCTVYSGAYRVADRRPPVTSANWSTEANFLWLTGLAVLGATALPGAITGGLLQIGFELRPEMNQLVGTLLVAAYALGAWTSLSAMLVRGTELLDAAGRRVTARLRDRRS